MFTLTKRTLSAAAVIAALTAPSTAAARPIPDPPYAATGQAGTQHAVRSGPAVWPDRAQQTRAQSHQQAVTKPFGPTGGLAGPAVRAHAADVNSVRPISVSSQGGFQWDDAGIGAAGILALLGLGAGSVTAITRRRTHHTRVS
jgi:hypothetical protein